MKKLITLILLFSSIAHAECDWSQIKDNGDQTYTYPLSLHLCVGQLVQANKDLTAAIQLKDLAITNSDNRIALWQKTAGDEQDRLTKIDETQRTNEYIAFGLGILLTIGAAYAVHATTH
jgi:hypothetical protein